MTGAMSQLKDASSFDKGDNAIDPVLPSSKGNSRGDEIVCECKGMIKQVEKDPHEALNKVHK